MAEIRVARVVLSLRVQVPEEALAQHLAASPVVVGEELARQVHGYAAANGLGYYPALDLFRRQGGIDPELLDAARDIAWFAGEWASSEIKRRLRGTFSSVAVGGLQARAFTLPRVRPSQAQAAARLAEHFTPDSLQLEVRVTYLHKGSDGAGFARLATQQVLRSLKRTFRRIEVADSTVA